MILELCTIVDGEFEIVKFSVTDRVSAMVAVKSFDYEMRCLVNAGQVQFYSFFGGTHE
jgi:hypothetical protein